jgi:hypothetical protein
MVITPIKQAFKVFIKKLLDKYHYAIFIVYEICVTPHILNGAAIKSPYPPQSSIIFSKADSPPLRAPVNPPPGLPQALAR